MPSFDVVSEVDMQEVKNAVDQAQREIGQRYDFKGSKSSLELKEKESQIILVADDKLKLSALQDILRQRLSKRNVSMKSVEFADPVPAGGDTIRQVATIKMALKDEELKKLNKTIKDTKLKVTSHIQGAQLSVSGKNRDDLQSVIAHLKKSITDIELQFNNFRD